MRMTKVSKPTATRDLAELVSTGAILPIGAGATVRYKLNGSFSDEPIEPLNEPLNDRLIKLIKTHPGVQILFLHSVVRVSRATVKRAIAALVREGKIEHRGSKKTGGYWILRERL